MTRAIGIDLGTTYTVLATIDGGRPMVVANAEGQRLMPSVVAVTLEGEILVGESARRQATANPGGTVFSIKRRMGSDYFVRLGGGEYSPQQVSSLILRKVTADAERRLGERITRAVITVPAYFNDRQRQATQEAAALAGLELAKIINEPTAAALAYGLQNEDAHTILVWDLGGGTFDVSILDLGEGIFQVRAVGGDTWLGGDDFDSRLAQHLAQAYGRAAGVGFPTSPSAQQSLREVAERAKIELSSALGAKARLPLEDLLGQPQVDIEVTREELERITEDLLDRMELCARQALDDANLTAAAIDRVLLVGGATRAPAVRHLVKKLFGKEPYRYIDPDEVVAQGAAVQSGMMLGLVDKAVLLDVLPLSLGIETQGGLVGRIIQRNAPLPASASRLFTTATDYQTSMDIQVFQGERPLAVDNVPLGRFQLTGIPPASRGAAKVEVTFQVDVDGMVHISARDLLGDGEAQVRLASSKLFDTGEIDHIAGEARRKAKEDAEARELVRLQIELRNLIDALQGMWDGHCSEGFLVEAGRIHDAVATAEAALVKGNVDDLRTCAAEVRRLLEITCGDESRSKMAIRSAL